jgi:ferredoxin
MKQTHQVVYIALDGSSTVIRVEHGANLRRALLAAGISPYTRLTKRANCGGRGLCATCGVWLAGGEPMPVHWHDRAAKAFGYPRLSCQITVTQDLMVRQVSKWIWGGRRSKPDSQA